MTPDFRIVADSKDVTAKIRDRLIELKVEDQAGMSSDSVEIRIDDRDNAIALPRRGAKLAISLGYAETGLAGMGTYTVDEVTVSGPPDTVVIRGKAADTRAGLKGPKSRSWDGVTLGALVATVAAEHGYTPKVGDSLSGVQLGHVDQTEESDLHLLTRLARRYGAVAKPAGDHLLFVPAGQAKSASGKDLPAVTLQRGSLSRWEATRADRTKYARVSARYRDLSAGADVQVFAGSGEPVYALRDAYPDHAAAIAAARAKLADLQRGEGTVSFDCAGDVRLAAEGTVTLAGVRDGVNGQWTLTSVTHTYADGGYRCSCEGKVPGSKGDAGN